MFVAVFALLLQATPPPQDTLPPTLQQAEDSLAAGRIDAAVDLAKHYTVDHRNDPRGFLVLGDAYAQRMPAGRFQAWKAYREAERLDRENPAPQYKMGLTGFVIGGADGERLARNGFERVLELDPHYADTWKRWLVLYRNDGGRHDMIERLRTHADPTVESWIARLQIELNEYAAADSNLDTLIARDSTNGSLYALRAQSAFEAGDSVAGARYYRLALRHADRDPQDILWHQAIGIATPDEIRAWERGIPDDQRAAWFAAFWERRNPDLFNRTNHRLLEHFRRLRYARAKFPMQHPLILYMRSRDARGLSLTPSGAERSEYLRCEATEGLGIMDARDAATVSLFGSSDLTGDLMATPSSGDLGMAPVLAAPPGIDLRDVDSTAARVGYNLETGLDDRGIMFLRFGPPDQLFIGANNATDPYCTRVMDDVQRWYYPGLGWVRFAIPSGFSVGQPIGSPIFRPMNEQQFHMMTLGLTSSASSVPAPLSFGVWTAEFRNPAVPAWTDLAVITTKGQAAAELVSPSHGPRGSVTSWSGHVTLHDEPGNYHVVVDAKDGEQLGRTELDVRLREFGPGPAVSDLLISRAGPDSEIAREQIFQRVPRDLTFDPRDTLRAYAEIYGLTPENGHVQYRVAYALLKTGDPAADAAKPRWPDATTFTFPRDRVPDDNGVAHEYLDLAPALLNRGTYLLRVTASDFTSGKDIGQALSEFTIR